MSRWYLSRLLHSLNDQFLTLLGLQLFNAWFEDGLRGWVSCLDQFLPLCLSKLCLSWELLWGSRLHSLLLLRDGDWCLDLGANAGWNEGWTIWKDNRLISAWGNLLRTTILRLLGDIRMQNHLRPLVIPNIWLWSWFSYLFLWFLLLLQSHYLPLILFDIKHVVVQKIRFLPLRNRWLDIIWLHVRWRDLLRLRLHRLSLWLLLVDLLRWNNLLRLGSLWLLLLSLLQLLIVLLIFSLNVVRLLKWLIFLFKETSRCLLQALLIFLSLRKGRLRSRWLLWLLWLRGTHV